MTVWKNQGWDKKYKVLLGADVYVFLEKEPTLISYLSDYSYVSTLNRNATELEDNSMYVLHICKFFEGALQLFAIESGWIDKFNPKGLTNIRNFFRANRAQIENEIDSVISDKVEQQDVKDKLFAIVQDFKERHEVVHFGNKLSQYEVQGYDAIITKVRDLISLGLEYGFLQK